MRGVHHAPLAAGQRNFELKGDHGVQRDPLQIRTRSMVLPDDQQAGFLKTALKSDSLVGSESLVSRRSIPFRPGLGTLQVVTSAVGTRPSCPLGVQKGQLTALSVFQPCSQIP